MKKATKEDKQTVINILTKAFNENLSVNYIIRQDKNRVNRIRYLMSYSFELCSAFGDVFLTEDNLACALIMYPDKKRTTIQSVWLDIKLIIHSVGLNNIIKTLKRESLIKAVQPKIRMSYLWFIGVDPEAQHNGIGSNLLQSVIDWSLKNNRPVYLETSTVKNLPWYERFGFEVYHEKDLSYPLYFFKKTIK